MRPRRSTLTFATCLLLPLVATCLTGCDEMNTAAPAKKKVAKTSKAKNELPKDREILGRKTTEIKDASKEIESGQAKNVGARKVVGKDPITISGNAYVSIIGQASMLNIKHAVDLYQAEKGEYPKSLEQFMSEIIQPNNIALPKLPVWQKYGYDVASHSLVILEYPDLKAQVDAEYDQKAGRTPR